MQYELNLRDYLRIFRKRKVFIIGTFCAVVAATAFNLSKQPYIYEASTTVKIEERKNIAGLLTEWIVYNPQDVMESETKIIRGFPIMSQVAARLGLIKENIPPAEAQEIVSGLQGQVETKKVENTNIIEISVKGGDPKEIAHLANTVAAVYVEQNLLEKTKQARTARQFIADQLAQLEARLLDAEEDLRGLGGKASELRLAEPIQKKIVELQFEVTALMQKYTERHPKIIQLKDQIKDLEGQIKGFSKEDLEYNRLLREVETNKKLYSMLKEKLEEARITEAQKVSDVSVVDPAVVPTAPIAPNKGTGMLIGMVLGLVLGTASAFLFETIDPSVGTVEDIENVIKLSVLGIIPSVHSEMETGGRTWLQKLSRRFSMPWARPKETERYVRLFVHHKPSSLVAEAFRNIQANLKISLENNAENNRVFMVTSSGPNEGKTTCLINLGLICAQSGLRTLLISSDLRRPAIAKAFGLKKEFGLREYLEGMLDFDAVVKNVSDMMLGEMGFEEILKLPGIENISLISSGDVAANPAAILTSHRFHELIQEAKKDFGLILFDSPPILPIADASILAPMMDKVIFVYEIGRTARQALMRAKMQVESTGAKIAGVVLNNIKPSTESIMFAYPYYYKYKYSEEKEAKKDKIKKV